MLTPKQHAFMLALKDLLEERTAYTTTIPEIFTASVGEMRVLSFREEFSCPYGVEPLSVNVSREISMNIHIYPEPPIDGTYEEV